MMFEHYRSPLLSGRDYRHRLLRAAALASGLIALSLLVIGCTLSVILVLRRRQARHGSDAGKA